MLLTNNGKEKQKATLVKLIDTLGIQAILTTLGQEMGYYSLTCDLYDAVANQAQGFEAHSLIAELEGQTKKANHLKEVANDLFSLAAKLEVVTLPTIERKEDNSQEIADVNSEYSLDAIFFTFFTLYGVTASLNAMIRVAEEVSQTFDQSQTFKHLGGKYESLKIQLEAARERYQATQNQTKEQVFLQYEQEEKEEQLAWQQLQEAEKAQCSKTYPTLLGAR